MKCCRVAVAHSIITASPTRRSMSDPCSSIGESIAEESSMSPGSAICMRTKSSRIVREWLAQLNDKPRSRDRAAFRPAMEGVCSRSKAARLAAHAHLRERVRQFSSRLSLQLRRIPAPARPVEGRSSLDHSETSSVMVFGGMRSQAEPSPSTFDRLRVTLCCFVRLLQVQVLPAEVISLVLVGSSEPPASRRTACALISNTGFSSQVLHRFVRTLPLVRDACG